MGDPLLKRDAQRNLQEVLAPHGHWIRLQEDNRGRIVQAAADNGKIVHYRYDSEGMLSDVLYSNGMERHYEYEGRLMTAVTDEHGDVLVRNWYRNGVVTRQLFEGGDLYTYVYAGKAGSHYIYPRAAARPHGHHALLRCARHSARRGKRRRLVLPAIPPLRSRLSFQRCRMSAMHVVRCGSGEPVLFIHGMPTSSRLWGGVTRRLCSHYSCFAVDLPGMGQTPGVPYRPGYLRALADQLDALRQQNGIERWHVVGHDAGSAVAVHYARYYPERVTRLALLAPALFPELRPYYLLRALRQPLIGELCAPLVQFAFWKIAMQRALAPDDAGDESDSSEAPQSFYAPFAGLTGSWQFMRLLRWGKPADLLADVPQFLRRLTMPALVIHGRRDPAIPEAFARRASSLLPNARLLTLDGGHFLPLNQPDLVASSLAGLFAAAPAHADQ